MDEGLPERRLRYIGKECFATFFEQFRDPSLSNEQSPPCYRTREVTRHRPPGLARAAPAELSNGEGLKMH